MRYLSVCSGIEAATVAWHPLGWTPAAFSEIEPFPCKVLAHHYPNTPNLGDMTKFKEWPDYDNIDLLVGGTPCQSFSVAGLRKGLDDPRGNLMLTYLAIADRYKPKWIVWENVPGVLSSNGGRDFGTFLGAMEKLGYGFAYRVLDAQFVRTDGYPYAVPQRRRRVFVVGCLGDWGRAAAVLFDSESLRGDTPPRREAGQSVTHATASCLTSSGRGVSRTGDTRGQDPVVAVVNDRVAPTINAMFGSKLGLDNQHIDSGAGLFVYDEQPIAFMARGDGADAQREVSPTMRSLCCGADGHQSGAAGLAVAFQQNHRDEVRLMNGDGQICGALVAQAGMKQQNYLYVGGVDYENNGHTMDQPTGPLLKGSPTGVGRPLPAVATATQVRRLTPRECERLQAFPDDYTNIPGASDTTRYKALGNSMAVNAMQLIGQRIQYVESIL